MRRESNRRAFLQTAAAVAALRLPTAQAVPGSMYVSLNASLVGGKIPWLPFARLAARVGYGGVDLSLPEAMKQGLAPTRRLLTQLKLRTASANLPVIATRDEAAFRKSMPELDAAAVFAAGVGCNRMSVVVPASSPTPKEELRKILKDRFSEVAQVLARHNVRLGFEFLGPAQFRMRPLHEFIWRMPEMLQFAKECGPNVGLVLDAWHWYHAGATPADILAAGKSSIVTVHVSDAGRMLPQEVHDDQRLLPGEGVIPLVDFFRALQQIGYQDGVSPEPLGRIPADMPPEEGARLGLESTLAVMRKAGVVS